MSDEFSRGKLTISVTVSAIVLLNSIGLWFNHYRLLKWYGELAQTLTDQHARDALRALQSWLVMNQDGLFGNQWLNYGVVIFLCLFLYVGYEWSRWVWTIYWLASGILGFVTSTATFLTVGQFDRLLTVSYTISLVYLTCGMVMITSPSVRTYIHAMRDPTSGVHRL